MIRTSKSMGSTIRGYDPSITRSLCPATNKTSSTASNYESCNIVLRHTYGDLPSQAWTLQREEMRTWSLSVKAIESTSREHGETLTRIEPIGRSTRSCKRSESDQVRHTATRQGWAM